MGIDIEATPHSRHLTNVNSDANSLKAPTKVGRQELADIVPPHDSYEGQHRFDPHASWSVEEERRVVLKTDLRLLTWLCLMMFGYAMCDGIEQMEMLTETAGFSSIEGICRMRLRIIC
jgi:hypothetical protein